MKEDPQRVFQNIERFFEDLFHEKMMPGLFWLRVSTVPVKVRVPTKG